MLLRYYHAELAVTRALQVAKYSKIVAGVDPIEGQLWPYANLALTYSTPGLLAPAFLLQALSLVTDSYVLLNVQYWLIIVARLKSFIDLAVLCALIYAYDLVMMSVESDQTERNEVQSAILADIVEIGVVTALG